MAALAVHWDLNKTQLSWVGSIGFVGMAIGASVGGLLADRIGRRQVFAATLLVYGLATGATALVNAHVIQVHFDQEYRSQEGLFILMEAGVEFHSARPFIASNTLCR